MINRKVELKTLQRLLKTFSVVGIIGARQVGKTTLVKMLAKTLKEQITYFDLENPADLARLSDPMLALKDIKGLVIIDEVQGLPDLFPIIRVLVDRTSVKTRFLILGSASPELLKQSSESLAERIIYHELKGFSLEEVGIEKHKQLWLRGGLPRIFLARSTNQSTEWRRAFIKTFLERDLPQLGINIQPITLRRFWTMIAHYHGQVWNASAFGRSFGVADTTVRNYLDLLVIRGNHRIGFEIKRTTSPDMAPSMRISLSDLNLKSIDVIHAGDKTFQLSEKIRAVALPNLLTDLKKLPEL